MIVESNWVPSQKPINTYVNRVNTHLTQLIFKFEWVNEFVLSLPSLLLIQELFLSYPL